MESKKEEEAACLNKLLRHAALDKIVQCNLEVVFILCCLDCSKHGKTICCDIALCLQFTALSCLV